MILFLNAAAVGTQETFYLNICFTMTHDLMWSSKLILKDLETKSDLMKDLLSATATGGTIEREGWKLNQNWVARELHAQDPNPIVLNVLFYSQPLSCGNLNPWYLKENTTELLIIIIVKVLWYYHLQIILINEMIQTPAPVLCVPALHSCSDVLFPWNTVVNKY